MPKSPQELPPIPKKPRATQEFDIEMEDKITTILEEGGETLESKMGAKIASVTEGSDKHAKNEDRALVSKENFAAVLDGLGSYGHGDRASQLAAEVISFELEEIKKDEGLTERELESIKFKMASALKKASKEILKKIKNDPKMKGMGTTASLVKLCKLENGKTKALIANVGDSRIYLLRKGKLQRLTKDDSILQYLIDKKGIGPEANPDEDPKIIDGLDKEYKLKGKIRSGATLALGSHEDFHEQLENKLALELVQEIDLQKGDTLMLCSDGIIDNVPDKEKEQVLNSKGNELELSEKLVSNAGIAEIRPDNPTATPDDKTAVIIKI
ncbi:PP2C family protein-serine/threonine phosphatase [Patescibacteria group bacterium]